MSKMPYLNTWKQKLAQTHGPAAANRLAEEIQVQFEQLLRETPLPASKKWQQRLKAIVLPGLALYQTLKTEYSGSPEQALVETDELFHAGFFIPQQIGIPIINRLLLDPFPLIRAVMRPEAVSELEPGEIELVEDSADCLAFNIHRCLTLEILTARGAPELTPLFCATDDWLAALMPKIRWERTQTLGRGGATCDFCWKRNKSL
jgi:hypothetical protein